MKPLLRRDTSSPQVWWCSTGRRGVCNRSRLRIAVVCVCRNARLSASDVCAAPCVSAFERAQDHGFRSDVARHARWSLPAAAALTARGPDRNVEYPAADDFETGWATQKSAAAAAPTDAQSRILRRPARSPASFAFSRDRPMSVWTLSMLAYVIDGVVDREGQRVLPNRSLI